tara:strand:+ start:2900 stop:3379 length:480 start_codon:yes stop_codon:yes gene_type:complete
MRSFSLKDINLIELLAKAKAESQLIFDKESTRKGRTLNDITVTNMYGLAAEQFLIEKCNFTDNPLPYQDVISPEGIDVEVKVTKVFNYIPDVLRRLKEKRKKYPSLYQPDWVFIYTNNKKTREYVFAGTYKWNGNTYVTKDWSLEIDREFLANYGGANN